MNKRNMIASLAMAMCALFVLAIGIQGALAQAQQNQESQQGMNQPGQQGMSQQGRQQAEASNGARLFVSPAGVRQIQQALQDKGFSAGKVDGMWGKNTRDAVKRFQEAQGLEPTGNLNLATIQSLGLPQLLSGTGQQRQARAGMQGQQLAQKEAARGGAPLYISPANLRQLQQQLKADGYHAGPVDGIWGPETQKAVRNYEQAKGLEPTGTVSLRLLSSIGLGQMVAGLTGGQGQQQGQQQPGRAYYGPQGQQGRQGGQSGMRQAQLGSGAPLYVSPEVVRQIQQALKQAGYNTGDINGKWDQQTSRAAKNYQQANNLEPTGNLDLETMHMLVSSANIDLMGGGQSGQQGQGGMQQQPQGQQGQGGMQQGQQGQSGMQQQGGQTNQQEK